MTKLKAQGYELVPPGRYVLEVLEAEPVNDYDPPQLRMRDRIAEGEYKGFEFVDYPNRGVKDGVKMGTKAGDIVEACLDRSLTPDEELDTDDLIGKKFEAMVVVKKTGKGNRTEHGSIGPHRPNGAEPTGPRPEGPDVDGDDFADLPF
jgi:hypothetical protein